jgi:hypothetical protein
MPFNGSGSFQRLYSWVVDAAGSIAILSTRMDAEMNGFAAGLSNCVTRDGQSPMSADLPMGGKKLVNMGAAVSAGDALTLGQAAAAYQPVGSYQATNANLTAYAGAAWSAGVQVPTLTAANTIALKTVGSSAGNLLDVASGNTLYQPVGSYQPAGSYVTTATIASYSTTAQIAAVYAPLASPALTGTPTINGLAPGYLDLVGSTQGAYTLVLADRGQTILASGNQTIPANASVAFPTRTVITFVNTTAGNITIAITTDTLTLAGSSLTGTRTLSQNGIATIVKTGAATWLISGPGVS